MVDRRRAARSEGTKNRAVKGADEVRKRALSYKKTPQAN
jgi:hypothetical protein